MDTICCPKCGEPLERGQYYYDLETDTDVRLRKWRTLRNSRECLTIKTTKNYG